MAPKGTAVVNGSDNKSFFEAYAAEMPASPVTTPCPNTDLLLEIDDELRAREPRQTQDQGADVEGASGQAAGEQKQTHEQGADVEGARGQKPAETAAVSNAGVRDTVLQTPPAKCTGLESGDLFSQPKTAEEVQPSLQDELQTDGKSTAVDDTQDSQFTWASSPSGFGGFGKVEPQICGECGPNASAVPAPMPLQTHGDVQTTTGALADMPSNPLCMRCLLECDIFRAILKVKQSEKNAIAKYICRPCNSVTTMSSRNIDQKSKFGLRELGGDDEVNFFRRAGQARDAHGNLQYSKVRAVLKEQFTARHISEHRKNLEQKYMPLSVWAVQGWDIGKIKAHGKTKMCPVQGIVYTQPIFSENWSDISQKIEEGIMEAERSVMKRKRDSGASESGDATVDMGELDEDDDVACNPPGKFPRRSTGGSDMTDAQKQAARRAETKAAEKEQKALELDEKKEAARVKREVDKHNSTNQILSNKTLSALTSLNAKLDKAAKSKAFTHGDIPGFLKAKYDSCSSRAISFARQADTCVKEIPKALKKSFKVAALEFSMNELQSVVKDANTFLTDFGKFEKLFK